MRRRELLAAPLAALAPRPAPAAEAARIRITALESFRVKVNQRGNWILVRMHTSEGLTGIGDCSHGGPDEKVLAVLQRFFERARGLGIFDVERLRSQLLGEAEANGRPGAVALSAIEQCLWDLQGKALGLPAYQLFGGKLRDKLRNYANINRVTTDRSPAGFARYAEQAVAAGFDAFKLAPFDGMPRRGSTAEIAAFTRNGVDCVAAVRKVIGPKRDLLVDGHSNFDLARGLALLKEMEPLNLFWLEEVTRPVAELAAINQAAKMPTAGGESIFGVKGFYPYVKAGAVDILMPDVKYCGGMLELKKVAAMAEGAGMPVSPHGPASPIGNVAAGQVCVTLPNFLILELGFGEAPYRAEVIEPPEVLDKGYLTIPDRPGFGIGINEKTARRYAA